VQRRLAAILAADVVGYSRLVRNDEAGTLAALRAHREDLIEPQVAQHEGRVVKLMGDGVLAEFSSAVNAVMCAIEIQRAMAERHADLPEDQRVRYRIGINIGDIVVEDHDILGDGVNVAARLQALAPPGGICLSGNVRDELAGKLDVAFEELGEQRLKNISGPVRAYLVSPGRMVAGPAPGGEVVLPSRPSIVVLPFANLSGDVRAGLSRRRDHRGHHHRAGSAELALRHRPELGFRLPRQGHRCEAGRARAWRALRPRGQRQDAGRAHARHTGQLIDAETRKHIWAERYDRVPEDLFAVQDDITERVVAAVEPHLYAEEGYRASNQQPESIDSWGLVVRALQLINKVDASGTRKRKRCCAPPSRWSPVTPGRTRS
jgi:adenylate cyclase